MRDWAELWHQFIVTLARQPVGVVLAVWTGLALVVVMASEGLLLNLFPGSVFQRFLEKMPARKRKSVVAPSVSAPTPKTASVAAAATTKVAVPPESATSPESAAEATARLRTRKNHNRKKPPAGPKSVRATSLRRRAAASRERRSRSKPRLLLPKN